ncbi:glycosyltransferase [Rhodobacteraceae bacterium B1Z28]|uniref:Glycosyltransferase n=1 Tax=Ruegeria haliotis TaxID=2747601 RepID=A0ABX2PVF2_9RHOB|nr:glycosyltransferase [Ruegeria haliotis]NVO57336.1 glycosyltransferase [Ruegeria haliotis]
MATVRNSETGRVCEPFRSKIRILYLAHDLDDAAIWRRVDTLRMGGADVSVAGFRRRSSALPETAMELGQTHNGRMMQRALTVLRQRLKLRATFKDLPAPDTILCRNLEMLALAAPLKRMMWSNHPVRLVYEVLDIHRLMVGQSFKAKTMRAVERRLCRHVDTVIVSSPAFQREHFDAYQQCDAPVHLVENKVVTVDLEPSGSRERRHAIAENNPLQIGWFGILRCQFSLHCLDAQTRARPGRFRVVLRGIPALDEMPEFHRVVESNPDLVFDGPYSYPSDLKAIYGDVDLAWLVDRYDKGQNSDWLLPNRLYESGLNRVPPIALAGTETARRLSDLGTGLILDTADEAAVIDMFDRLTPAAMDRLRSVQNAVPDDVWRTTPNEARNLVDAITGKSVSLISAPCDMSRAAVLIVVPTLNEAPHIADVIDGLVGFFQRQKILGAPVRLVIADGGSNDGTQDIVRDRIAALPDFDIRLMDNPARLQSAALNAACDLHGEGMDWLIRMDAHARYPEDYADILLEEASRTGAASVVVSMHAVGTTQIQRAIALTQNSRLGNGGAAHRRGGSEQFVDHGHHALMRLDAFRFVGGYDAGFAHNEDAELDMRLTQSGYRIWMTSRTRLEYLPRNSISALFWQYFNFGAGRARTMLKHRQRPRLRQLAMISIAPMLVSVVLAPLFLLFALPVLMWISACLTGGAALALSCRDPMALWGGPIAAVMHLGWSTGFWRQLLKRPARAGGIPEPQFIARETAFPVDQIAVGICTYRRASLFDTLGTLELQNLPDGTRLTIIVVDNDDGPSARGLVDRFANGSRHDVVYRFAPCGNISIARNAALEEAEQRGLRAFAFIDDDELAPPNWLNTLVTRLFETDAEVVVGPVRAVYGPDAPVWMRSLRIHDTNPERTQDGRPIVGHSCNVIMDLGSQTLAGRRFDLARGVSGGEDTAFFQEAMEDGARLAFAPCATVEEPVAPERATISWLVKRRFRMGQTHGSLLRNRRGFKARLLMLPLAFAKVFYCIVFALLNAPFTARRNSNLLRGALHLGTIAALIGFREVAVYGAPRDKARAG